MGDSSDPLSTPAPVRVRRALPDDAESIANIYNDGIRGRSATFETRERGASDIRTWYDERYPFMVAELQSDGGKEKLAGWVRASPYRVRECYAGIAEFSVYVATGARGKRVGDTLMAAFMIECESTGFWKIVSRIFPENLASRALCARHGFREVGTYEKHAQLDGRWRDVVIVECLIRANLIRLARPGSGGG
jgi:L-amino acid N-acyltransferase YncA